MTHIDTTYGSLSNAVIQSTRDIGSTTETSSIVVADVASDRQADRQSARINDTSDDCNSVAEMCTSGTSCADVSALQGAAAVSNALHSSPPHDETAEYKSDVGCTRHDHRGSDASSSCNHEAGPQSGTHATRCASMPSSSADDRLICLADCTNRGLVTQSDAVVMDSSHISSQHVEDAHRCTSHMSRASSCRVAFPDKSATITTAAAATIAPQQPGELARVVCEMQRNSDDDVVDCESVSLFSPHDKPSSLAKYANKDDGHRKEEDEEASDARALQRVHHPAHYHLSHRSHPLDQALLDMASDGLGDEFTAAAEQAQQKSLLLRRHKHEDDARDSRERRSGGMQRRWRSMHPPVPGGVTLTIDTQQQAESEIGLLPGNSSSSACMMNIQHQEQRIVGENMDEEQANTCARSHCVTGSAFLSRTDSNNATNNSHDSNDKHNSGTHTTLRGEKDDDVQLAHASLATRSSFGSWPADAGRYYARGSMGSPTTYLLSMAQQQKLQQQQHQQLLQQHLLVQSQQQQQQMVKKQKEECEEQNKLAAEARQSRSVVDVDAEEERVYDMQDEENTAAAVAAEAETSSFVSVQTHSHHAPPAAAKDNVVFVCHDVCEDDAARQTSVAVPESEPNCPTTTSMSVYAARAAITTQQHAVNEEAQASQTGTATAVHACVDGVVNPPRKRLKLSLQHTAMGGSTAPPCVSVCDTESYAQEIAGNGSGDSTRRVKLRLGRALENESSANPNNSKYADHIRNENGIGRDNHHCTDSLETGHKHCDNLDSHAKAFVPCEDTDSRPNNSDTGSNHRAKDVTTDARAPQDRAIPSSPWTIHARAPTCFVDPPSAASMASNLASSGTQTIANTTTASSAASPAGAQTDATQGSAQSKLASMHTNSKEAVGTNSPSTQKTADATAAASFDSNTSNNPGSSSNNNNNSNDSNNSHNDARHTRTILVDSSSSSRNCTAHNSHSTNPSTQDTPSGMHSRHLSDPAVITADDPAPPPAPPPPPCLFTQSLPHHDSLAASQYMTSPGLSPSPYYSATASMTSARRVHRETRIPLPLTPAPVDFSTLRHTLEDRYTFTRKVSEGTYGEVYLGTDRRSGVCVALKRLKTLRGLDGFPITSLREVIALQHIQKQRARLTAQQSLSNPYSPDPGPNMLPRTPHTTTDSSHVHACAGGSSGHNEPSLASLPSASATTAMEHATHDASDPLEDFVALRDVLISTQGGSHDIVLVFDYCVGSMAGLLARRFPFALPELRYIFRRLVTATAKLHAMGIIHRDIKSDNVLLSADGGVKLADFGLCVFSHAGSRALTPSMINLAYRPPEMLLGSVTYDAKVDVWSIGCFLAQVFLGTPPFYRAGRPRANANLNKNNNMINNNRTSSSGRGVATELEQLALVCEVLGPMSRSVLEGFSVTTCKNLSALRRVRDCYYSRHSSSVVDDDNNTNNNTMLPNRTRNRTCSNEEDDVASNSLMHGVEQLQPLFEESFLYTRYGGFRDWFLAALENRRARHAAAAIAANSNLSNAVPHLLIPSPACLDVLCAILQLDPRRRPTAAELLHMPFFQLSTDDTQVTPSASFAQRTSDFGAASLAAAYGSPHVAAVYSRGCRSNPVVNRSATEPGCALAMSNCSSATEMTLLLEQHIRRALAAKLTEFPDSHVIPRTV